MSHLPDCWRGPEHHAPCTPRLFNRPQAEFLATIGVSWDELCRWHERKWISFNPTPAESFMENEEWEIDLVSSMTSWGMTDAIITIMLRGLQQGVKVPAERLAFHFQHGWVTPAYLGPQSGGGDDVGIGFIELHLEEYVRRNDETSLLRVEEVLRDSFEDLYGYSIDPLGLDDIAQWRSSLSAVIAKAVEAGDIAMLQEVLIEVKDAIDELDDDDEQDDVELDLKERDD